MYPHVDTDDLNYRGALFPDAQIVWRGEGQFVMSTHTFRSNAEPCHALFFLVDDNGNEIVLFFELHYCVVGDFRLYGTTREETCDL